MSLFNYGINGYGFPLPRNIIKKYVDKSFDIINNRANSETDIDISRSTVMYLCGHQTMVVVYIYRKCKGLLRGRLVFLKKQIDRMLQCHFTKFRYRTHYLSLKRKAAFIDIVLNKGINGYEGDIQEEWDICMQTPDLYDAGQVIDCRLKQAEWYGLTEGVEELKAIRNRILELRKE